MIDRLADGEVRLVAAVGFPPGTDGSAAQCTLTTAGLGDCGPAVPIRFDDRGHARFLFQFGARVETTGDEEVDCAAASEDCTLAVTSPGPVGLARTVFGAPAPPPGQVTVTPARGLRDRQDVTVTLSGFPPRAQAALTQCVPSATAGGGRCGAPADVVPVIFDEEGRATVRYRVLAGPVGREGRGTCGRGRPCGISVTGAGLFARAPVTTIVFAGRPPAQYEPDRLVVGGGLFLVMLAMAAGLVRRTDWGPVGDVATLDDA